MKVISTIVSTVSALFIVMLTTPFAIETGGKMLSEIANALNMHEAPALFVLVVLIVLGLYLYRFGQDRHSAGRQNDGHRHRQKG